MPAYYRRQSCLVGRRFDERRPCKLRDVIRQYIIDIPSAGCRETADLGNLYLRGKLDAVDGFDKLVVAALQLGVFLDIQGRIQKYFDRFIEFVAGVRPSVIFERKQAFLKRRPESFKTRFIASWTLCISGVLVWLLEVELVICPNAREFEINIINSVKLKTLDGCFH